MVTATQRARDTKGCRIIPILGDQLSEDISSLEDAVKSRDVIIMAEVREEATYVRHHKKKIAFIFSAMRHHAKALRKAGWSVDYIAYDDDNNPGSIGAAVKHAIDQHDASGVIATKAGEHRLRRDQEGWAEAFDLPVDLLDDDRFVCTQEEFDRWAEGRKSLRMEYFYRDMRRKTGLLMDGDEPAGGEWNFDKENRKAADDKMVMPERFRSEPDKITRDVITLVDQHFGNHFGALEPFWFAVTREDAEKAVDHFMADILPSFGDYQDAMLTDERFLFHSLLSFYIHVGLLDPVSVCRRAEIAYRDGSAPINAVEGFIRQIIGWREYINGIYWRHYDDDEPYTEKNYLGATRPLPEFYWTAETDMLCLRQAVEQTRDEAYAHHIQRLMVTGLFALLIGANPKEVHEWYLCVYADAYEWVEAPNVIGMSQFADGGELGSKPYAASGAYINRMSNYCRDCTYAVSKKTEEGACPFNALYWDFLNRHTDKFKSNPRMAQMYRTWDRMKDDTKSAYKDRARQILKKIDDGIYTDI